MKHLVIALMLCGCHAGPAMPLPPEAAQQPSQTVALAAMPPTTVAAPTVATVVKHFDTVRAKELTVVTHDASSAQIAAIRQADVNARAALTAMGKQGKRVTPASLDAARAAVRNLEQALDQPL